MTWSVLTPFQKCPLLASLRSRMPGWFAIASYIVIILRSANRVYEFISAWTLKGFFFIYLPQKFKWVSFLAGSFDKMLNSEVSSPQLSYVSEHSALSMCSLNFSRPQSALSDRDGVTHVLNWSHTAECLGEGVFQWGKGKLPCDLFVCSQKNWRLTFTY